VSVGKESAWSRWRTS